jgi:hypothetical protein
VIRSPSRRGDGATLATVRYDVDILEDLDARRRPASSPSEEVAVGLVVEDRSSGFRGAIVRWNAEGITVQSGGDHVRHFTWKPGGFRVDGRVVTLRRPAGVAAATPRITASGSVAGDGTARVARAARIWVEGVHDAELVEQVWGDDLRELGVVVEPMHGADGLASAVARFEPGPTRRLGVLLDHLVAGSKESRLAAEIDDPDVLVVGHPFVDVWAAVRPSAVGLQDWPEVPRSVPSWKEGLCDALGVPVEGFWPRLRNSVRSFADLRPELVGAVEQLIDHVAAPAGSER